MGTSSKSQTATSSTRDVSRFRWFVGMCIASVFSLVYLVAPVYILTCIISLAFQYPTRNIAIGYSLPMIVSAIVPSISTPRLSWLLNPMLDYFDYNEEFELDNEAFRVEAAKGKRFIIAIQPHGVISFVGLCSWVSAPPDFRRVKTAVASALLLTPILKHVMGIFGLTDASASNLRRHLKNEGVDGCIIIYTGGLAEMFKSCHEEERLYLKKRKGFIKLALREGVDVVPAYFFGNTSVLTLFKAGPLGALSRKLQVSLTYFWGKWNLPIPRDDMLLYVRGKPLGIPHIPNPSKEDVDTWHAKYVEEVTRLFYKYNEKLPSYKHKKLFID